MSNIIVFPANGWLASRVMCVELSFVTFAGMLSRK